MIQSSPFGALDVPRRSFADHALACAGDGDRAALIDGTSGRTLSFAELERSVRSVAAALAERGLRKGEVFAICLPNLPEYGIALLAALSLGAIVAPVNPLLAPGELVHQLADAGARYLLTLPRLLEPARETLRECGLNAIVVLGEAEGATPWAELLAHEATAAATAIDPDIDVALLPCSSGTTGLPKGVMLTHRNLVANAQQFMRWPLDMAQGTVAIGAPPMFHSFGVSLYFGALLPRGVTVITLQRFELELFLRLIERHRAGYAAIVQPIARALAEDALVERYDLSSLRRITSGSAPLGEALSLALERRLGVQVFESYGMTELCGASHAQRPGDPKSSVGVALAGIEWQAVDPDTGRALNVREQGEIRVRGPNVMKGYLNRPQDSSLEAPGWLRTGDLGYADEQGRLYITGRLKELIKVSGYQVAPEELEALLRLHPEVCEACVVGRPDGAGGEAPVAYVVRKGPVEAQTLAALVAARLAPYKRLAAVFFVDALPRSHTGKVLRSALAARKKDRPEP